MTRDRSLLGTTRPRRDAILFGVIALVTAALVWPYLPVLRATPFPVLLVAGLAGFYARRRVLDALLFVACHLCAELLGEPLVDANALATLTLGLLALSGRPRFALATGTALFLLFLASVELKQRFAGSALTWHDLRYFFLQFGDNIGVAFSQPTLLMYTGGACVALVATTVFFWRSDRAAAAAGLQWRLQSHQRLAARLLAAAMAAWCATELLLAAKGTSQRPAWIFSEMPRKTPVSTFLSTLHLQPVASYEKVDTAQFARDVKALQRNSPGSASAADIVLFLQESQFNPMAVEGCPPSLCKSPLFDSDGETTDDGELRVHTYGGGTWLSEFAVATGLPHTLFGRSGEYASFNVAPGVNRSFVRSLKAAGYHTVAVYPVNGGMMNARIAYHGYGFDEFLDATDLGLPGNFDTPDAVMHTAAVRALKRAQTHSKPVFLLALTIFNHGEHGLSAKPVPRELKHQARQAMQPEIETDNLADYVWRTREFGKAYAETRAAVLESPRPAVLAWFGDHQPPFGTAPKLRGLVKASAAQPPLPDRMVTWYHVATNTQRQDTGPRRRRLDIAFLPGLLAQRAGVPLDDWLAANALARERCDGLLIECADTTWRNAYYSYVLGDLQSIR